MLAFLHTARAHVATFAQLARDIDDTIPVQHRVAERLLADATTAGTLTNAVRAALADEIRDLARVGSSLIVCTCSTLGGAAESAPTSTCTVMRIDRPMAEQAVFSGRRIIVIAALRSTLAPTTELLRQVAANAKRSPVVVEVLNESAWRLWEGGEPANYAQAIAQTIAANAQRDDIVLLAQASMAPASELVRHLGVPVLSSPKSGVIAAMAKYRALEKVVGARRSTGE
ncbi:MAG: hypothetical protein ABJB12_09155 [Pseudomonadota bacterium]